tara:strand:- start:2629 stop:3387 length:759 start_codon:yes stop_codon:yes gene_type:complete
MNYKFILVFCFILFVGCENKSSNVEFNKNFDLYSNKGFALIYNDDLLKKKIVNKKMDERSLIVFNINLKEDTPVKITNLINGKNLVALVQNKSTYPKFYNSVISQRIAKDLEIDQSEPYIKIQTINSRNSFIANKAKTFDEEKKVATKAPVESITIKNIGLTKEIKENNKIEKKIIEFNYIIKFADLYFEDSAIMLKDRLLDEYKINNVSIKKLSNNSFRVYKGPYKNLKSIKNAFNSILNLDFDNIEIIKL